MTDTQVTIEEFRQKIIDIFVFKSYPKTYIRPNFEEILVNAFEGKEANYDQV